MSQSTTTIDLAGEPRFRIGAVPVDPAACQIGEKDAEVRVEPRVMQVLLALWKAKGEALSRDDLIEMCWSGRAVSDDAIHRCIAALRKAASAFMPPPYSIETLPRVGYRLVEAEQYSETSHAAPDGGASLETNNRLVRRLGLAAAITLMAASGLWLITRPAPNPRNFVSSSEEQRISIGVAPFVNHSPNGDNEFFVDGLTDELIIRLGAIEGVDAPGRASSFQIKGKSLSAQEIATALDVQYVLEGAVLREGDAMRITAQLTDGATGYQVWSEVFDRRTESLLELQSEIARDVMLSIPAFAGRAAPAEAQTVVDPRAHELFLIGVGHLQARYFDGGWPEARNAFEAAVRLDPDYAAASAYLAIAIAELRPSNAEQRAKEALAVAVENAPGSAPVLFAQGWIEAAFGLSDEGPDASAAREFFDRSLALDPTNSEALRARARLETDPDRKLSLLRNLTEQDPLFYAARLDLATELANRGYVEEAFEQFDKLLLLEPARGIRGAIELARAGSDLDKLGRYAFGAIGEDIATRPDRLLIAGLLADFGAVEEARFLYAHPAPDPLLFLPKRQEVYLGWLDGDSVGAFSQMAGVDYSRVEGSSVFGAGVALFASEPEAALRLVIEAYPDIAAWSDDRLAAVKSLPEVIGAHIYGMALRQTGEQENSRRVLMALVPAVNRLYPGETAAQRRYLGLAILFAQAGETNRAIEELRKARAAGWRFPRTYTWVNYAPAPAIDAENGFLAPLRDEPEFRSMMEDIRTENRAALVRFEREYGFIGRLRAMMASTTTGAPEARQ